MSCVGRGSCWRTGRRWTPAAPPLVRGTEHGAASRGAEVWRSRGLSPPTMLRAGRSSTEAAKHSWRTGWGRDPTHDRWADWRTSLKPMRPQPQFLSISWEDTGWEGTPVTMRAVLCLRHRKEIGLEYPSARGCSQPGEACDFCEGRKPRTLQGASSLAPAQQKPEIVSVDRPLSLSTPRGPI
jgi:hypothetical protein